MDRYTADKIINCLECGIVPMDCVKYFSAGREKEIGLIQKLLSETESGNSGLLFVHGHYGIGKTHILGLTLDCALERGFIASHVTLTSRECPLSHLNDVYRNILKNLFFRNDINFPRESIFRLSLFRNSPNPERNTIEPMAT